VERSDASEFEARKERHALATGSAISSTSSGSERLSRVILALTLCLGGLGMLALLYFPLAYLK